MTQDELMAVQHVIEMQMYYIGYPENISIGLWKDGAGDRKYIDDMGFEHLQMSIRRIEKDIDHLERSGRQEAVINTLVPLARHKKDELQKALDAKRKER